MSSLVWLFLTWQHWSIHLRMNLFCGELHLQVQNIFLDKQIYLGRLHKIGRFFFLQHVQLLSVHLIDSKVMIYQVPGLDLYCNPSQTLYDAFRELIDLGRQNESEF